MTDRPDETHPMSSTETAPRALNAWPTTIAAKVETLAARQAALKAEVQRAQAGEAMTRARLGKALMLSLEARARREAEVRAAGPAQYRAAAPGRTRPDRRNRLRRIVERLAVRAGPKWAAKVIERTQLRSADWAVLFDADFYLARNPDVAAGGGDPLAHYILAGGREGRWPNRYFDPAYYLDRNGIDLGVTGLTALEHYVRIGAPAGFETHPLFRLADYLMVAPELFQSDEPPLAHYLRVGAAAGLSPLRFFRPDYYLAQAGEIARADPLGHFLDAGWRQGLKPHPLFDPAWFVDNYPECGELDPLTYYVLHGTSGTLSPGPWLDAADYAARRGGLNGADPLSDYLDGGAWAVGEQAPGYFVAAYMVSHPEFAEGRVTPLEFWAGRNTAG